MGFLFYSGALILALSVFWVYLENKPISQEEKLNRILQDGGDYVTFNDNIIEYFEKGEYNLEKPIILIINGFGSTGKFLPPQLQNEKLIKNFYIISLSLPGFGGTSRIIGRKLEMFHEFVEKLLMGIIVKKIPDVTHVKKIVEKQPLYLVGASFGCMHVLELVQSNKFNVKKAVLFAPSAPTMAQASDDPVSASITWIISHVYSHFPKMFLNLFSMKLCTKYEGFLDDMKRNSMFTYKGFHDNSLVTASEWNFSLTKDNFKISKDDLLITVGEYDEFCGMEHWNKLKSLFPQEYEFESDNIRMIKGGHCHFIPIINDVLTEFFL